MMGSGKSYRRELLRQRKQQARADGFNRPVRQDRQVAKVPGSLAEKKKTC